MPTPVVVDVVRTPLGRRNGRLAGWHPVDLLAEVLRALVGRNDLDPALVDDVIAGCVMQVGEQALNVARNAVLAAGFPEEVPATTVDRACGSSQQAIHFAAQGVAAGAYDVVLAGGVESMTRVPMFSSVPGGPEQAYSPALIRRYAAAGGLVHQGLAAEALAEKYALDRETLDVYSLRSHQRAAAATAAGHFAAELIVLPERGADGGPTGTIIDSDEGIRSDASLEGLAVLRTVFREDGRITAGNSSQITDGAAGALIMSEERAAELGLRPRARFVSFAVTGVDPIAMLTGPIPATERALHRAGIDASDLDHAEVNEAFAPVPLAWLAEFHPDPDRLNPSGGAIALGHPLGCSGARLLATLVCGLERTGGRYGLQTMCEAGGMANATVIERLG
jgi:acetyl-CoA acetyltransferase family protein